MYTLRDYQQEGVDQIRGVFADDGAESVLYVLPTGGGKTVMFVFIAANAAARGTRTCICVHRRELLHQTSKALREMGVPHGVINANYPASPGLVQVATVQTLVRRTSLAGTFDFIVFDEGHHGVSQTWRTIRARYPGARLLGVTATPWRLDGKGLGDIYEHLVTGPGMPWLIEHGYLSPVEVWAPAMAQLKGLRTRAGDYQREALAELMDKRQITGCAVEHYRRLLNGRPAIAFCASVAHAEHVAAQFRAEGYRAESIDGTLRQDVRDDRIAALGDGRLSLLASCDLISEGVDVPVVAGAILLRPTKSTALHLQQVGRALRPAPGKDKAIILDHVGNTLRHGLPDQDRVWSLDKGLVREADQETGPDVCRCEYCYSVHEWAPSCPYCGFVYPPPEPKPVAPEQAEGELKKITAEERGELMKVAKTLQDWHRIAKASGYKPGWAWWQFKRRNASRKLEGARV